MASTSSSSGRSPVAADNIILPYRMHVSQRYLDLTRQKLNLTRLPREPRSRQPAIWSQGVGKAELEPLVDYWMEAYDWRAPETHYNNALPQYRVVVQGTRLHYVHKRSGSPNAIPLVLVHGFPESFVGIAHDGLTDPRSTPPIGNDGVPAFDVVAPSIPGFGFSDMVAEEGNNIAATAELFDALMKSLGYPKYIAIGSGWGFNICRLMALTHSESCIAIHTANPDLPDPRISCGYPQPLQPAASSPAVHGLPAPLTPGSQSQGIERPQTLSYAMCDSPTGLLAHVVDAIGPSLHTSESLQITGHPSEAQTVWTRTALLDWCMLYWLPGPEVAFRWLNNSGLMVPQLWRSHSHVPLAISHFVDQTSSQPGTQRAENYFRVAMVRRRAGRVRFPAWERPVEMIADIRELAGMVAPISSPGRGY